MPFHATLAFLGDVLQSDLSGLCAAIASSVQSAGSFELELKTVGAFPSAARPRVIWAGLTAVDLAPLLRLQEQVARAAAESGYRPDDKQFHPHVTLGRPQFGHRATCDLSATLERYRYWSGGSFRVNEVITFASTPDKGGSRYDPMARASLAGTIPDASP